MCVLGPVLVQGYERDYPRRKHSMPAEIVLLVNEHLLDLIVCRIRATGIDATLAPPNGIRIATEFEDAEDVQFFPGLSETSQAKILCSLLGVSYDHLTTDLFPSNPLVAVYPFETQSGATCHLNHGTLVQMLYNSLAGPRECLLGPSCGGVLVLWFGVKHADGGITLEGNGLEDEELMEVAEARMEDVGHY